MDFPKDNTRLDEIFINGSDIDIAEFSGEYWVGMLTGLIPSFRWAGHRKRFFKENEKNVGLNIILLNAKFGHFFVEEGDCPELNNLNVAILNYGEKRNILTRSMIDKLRKVEEDIYLGRYYNQIHGELKFKGYFSLIKK